MVRGVGWYLFGGVAVCGLAALAGCSGGSFMAEREPWRHEAEAKCLDSGAVREGAGVARVKPINGPGMCGADFPLRVSALSEGRALGYGDELRPPGGIPRPSADTPPRWPIAELRYGAPPQPQYDPRPAAPQSYDPQPYDPPPYDSRVVRQPLRNAPGAPQSNGGAGYDMPLSLDPPPAAGANGGAIEPYDFRRPYGSPASAPAREPPRMSAPQVVPLAPSRAPSTAFASVSVTPAATLACPIVSVLDQWFASAVQPAAMRWFGQPVVEIRQISAYSCRGMNGNPNARISEHAFGNALDIAAFTLADGHKITVKGGWHGTPEEQGFLRDVQGAACAQFNTVLAPGSNVYHYDHIHVDLMRRRDGHRACNPHAVAGEVVAARARTQYEARRMGEASITGAIPARRTWQPQRLQVNSYAAERRLPLAEPGNDGLD
jgi:hypothetical protein